VDPYLGYEIAGAAVLGYALIVYALWRTGRVGPDRSLTLFGPALMIKTRRGVAALDRGGRFVRFWTVASDVGVGLAALAMAVIVGVLFFGAIAATRLSPAQAPPLSEAVALPGLNPVIPLTYGIVALVVGIVLHELCHGVVARSQKIGVKSLGILWCVVPVGAFVEQDDAQMTTASRRRRDRVAAAGVLANFVLAVVFFVALSALVGTSVAPNASGVGVAYVEPNGPANNVSVQAGDIITGLNGTTTATLSAFENAIAATQPFENVSVVYFSHGLDRSVTRVVELGRNPSNRTRGFLGIEVYALTPSQLRATLVWPLGASAGGWVGALDWLILPFGSVEPVSSPTASFFHLVGPLHGMSPTDFWVGANLLYWLAWMNLLLGLSNALPLVPLDGGLLFRDFAASVAARFRRGWTAAQLDLFAARASVFASFIVLLLLAWQFVVPRLG